METVQEYNLAGVMYARLTPSELNQWQEYLLSGKCQDYNVLMREESTLRNVEYNSSMYGDNLSEQSDGVREAKYQMLLVARKWYKEIQAKRPNGTATDNEQALAQQEKILEIAGENFKKWQEVIANHSKTICNLLDTVSTLNARVADLERKKTLPGESNA